MFALYSALLAMIALAVILVALPFIRHQAIRSIRFAYTVIFIIIFTLSIYHFSGNKTNLRYWLTQGESRYRLLTQFDDLGGIDGAIKRIQERLATDPNDAQGWLILSRLYLAKSDKVAAKKALKKYQDLQSK